MTATTSRSLLISVFIFIVTLAVYFSNGFGYLSSFDTAPNSLLVLNAIENHRLDFDNVAADFPREVQYIFTRNATGHIQSTFPIGAALVSAPFYIAIDAFAHARHQHLNIASPSFEHKRRVFEKLVAAMISSLAAVMLFFCVREIGSESTALLLTATFAFATSMWAISSQAIWQHGPVNLVLLLMTFLLLQTRTTGGPNHALRIAGAGLLAGLLIVVRPTTAFFSIAALAWILYTNRRSAAIFFVTMLLGAVPAVAWNLANFHSVAGGYTIIATRYHPTLAVAGKSLAALALSPSKGLFVYLPLTAFSIFGACLAARCKDSAARLLFFYSIAGLLLCGSYSVFDGWWGGASFGPRYLTDLDALFVLLLVPVIDFFRHHLQSAQATVTALAGILAISIVYSVGVQAVGAYGEPTSEWSVVPLSIDTHLDRIWEVSDSQIARDVRAAYHRFRPDPAKRPDYLAAFGGRVTSLRSACFGSRTQLMMQSAARCDATADVLNSGKVPLYGYTTGIFYGQAVVRVHVTNLATGQVQPDEYLFISGITKPDGSATATGTLTAPAYPGRYRVICTVAAQLEPLENKPNNQIFSTDLIVR